LDLYRGNLPPIQLRGEIGPLTDEHDRSGAYALLLGVDGEEARLNALPYGILRLDSEGNVVFANLTAEKLFGAGVDRLRGRPAVSLFRSGQTGGGSPPIESWLASADGHKELAELQPLERDDAIPVRITVTPSFDTAKSRAGVVLLIVPISNELVRNDLQQLLSIPDCEPERLIRGVMQAVRRVVPYDLATFGIYTEDMCYHHTLVVHPQPEWVWTTAWFELGSEVREFLLGSKTWGNDLQAASRILAPKLVDDPVLKHLISDGMKAFVTLPISGGGRRVRASLTLHSKQADRYDGKEIEQMRELGVEKALLVAEANLQRRREDRVRTLETELATASEYGDVAQSLARGIANCFGWDYVAVFGVDRRENLFRLIHQCNRTGGPDVSKEYTQPLTEGLLGRALQSNTYSIEPNIEKASPNGYKAVVPRRRSALAMPVRLRRMANGVDSDEVEWMLSVESNESNAFQGPDMFSLKEIVVQCEQILRMRWQKAVQASLLNAVEQAVIIVDRAGRVRLTNRWADTLLGHTRDAYLGEMLSNLGADENGRLLLKSTEPVTKARLKLLISKDVTVPTLATQSQLNDDYGHRLWLFTDLRELEQQSNWRYLEQTVNEVAQNARLPLMQAGTLIRSALKLDQSSNINTLLQSAVRQIGKADIPYERLANNLAIRQGPDRPRQIFDALDVLRQAVADLPEEDVGYCDLTDLQSEKGLEPFQIAGWPEQLNFAFRSLLGYLLIRRPPNATLRISINSTRSGALQIDLSVPTGALPDAPPFAKPLDRIDSAQQRAQEAASLASAAVKLAIRRHNGEFSTDARDNSKLAFKVKLRRILSGSLEERA